MGILQQISADLASLSSDSKRRNTDIRHASDKSLELIKSYQSQTHNDDTAAFKLLSKSPEFINPFLLACQSKNIKFTSIALQCLNRLIMVQGLPVTKIDLLIDALLESTHSSLEIQLKILQLLPGFFQNYALFISDESLSKLLLVCSSLQSANKMGAVINTAQATFSQMLNIVFEKVYEEDKVNSDEDDTNAETDSLLYDVPIDDNATIKVGPCAYDAQRIVNDLCTLIEHHKPSYMKTNYLTEDYGFELLEGIIKNNQSLFLSHVELGYLLRIRVAPILLRFLSSSKDFTVMVRVSRLIFLLINDEFDILRIECEVTLSLLTHTLNKEIGAPQWKKILALEIYNGILKNFPLVKKIYLEYDHNEDEERKKVLKDFLVGCLAIVDDCKQLLNTGDIIQPSTNTESQSAPGTAAGVNDNNNNSKRSKTQPSYQEDYSKQIGLSASWSSVKQCYIDAIDKQDAPPVPDTYQLYLVSQAVQLLSEGICKAALDLATSTDENDVTTISFLDETSFDKEKQFEKYEEYICVSSMTQSYWEISLDIYRTFLHSTLDNEIFSKLIRSLQKLGHASGILSIKEARTEILRFFAASTLVLKGKIGYQNRLRTLVGTISSTIGQAVSNMATTTHTDVSSPAATTSVQLYTRNVNSRQTLCFRVLISLGISLAGILKEDWEIVLITLQWISYFIDGPSAINTKDIPPMSPFLNNSDLKSFETSLNRFTEGINAQPTEVFHQVITSIHELSEKVLKSSLSNPESFCHEPLNSAGALEPCIYNKDFYMNKLTDICEINPLKFLIADDKNWEYVTKSYITWSCDRSLDDDTRLLSTRSFDTIVNATANAGFNQALSEQQDFTSEEYERTREIVEYKVLQSLYEFLTSLGNLPTSNEQLIMDCEVEMNLQSLNTLKGIVDRFGTVIQNNWNVVTSMLNSPFEFIKNADASLFSKKSLNDTITSVLRCSFETMKVILDEILQSIPMTQISVIIDTLYNYVSQKFDLNISFNSVSYFWLISDYLKEKIDVTDGNRNSNIFIEDIIHSEDELVEVIGSPEENLNGKDTDFYECLLLYLILKLAQTTNDVRTQVRNGSIMTFFNVLNSYGTQCPSWILIYRIVLKPVIMEIKPNSRISECSQNEQKEWIESYTHVINGISKLFTQYLLDFEQDDNEKSNMVSFWKSLVGYMTAMSNLEFNWIELNLHILKAYGGVLQHFVTKKEEGVIIPNEIIEEFYNFWVGFQISYNLSNDMLYQESLSAFVSSFDPLFKLLKPILTLTKFEKMLTIFNTCIRYPVLINNQRDDIRCTELQKLVVQSLSSLDFDDPKYKSLLIQQLNLIVTLPFSTRELIEKKIGDRGIRIPTFIAASYESISLLKDRLNTIDDLTPYLNDKCLLKVFKALLEPSTLKNDFKKPERDYLWMESFDTVVNLTTRVCKLIEDPVQRQSVKPEIIQQIWPLILEVFKACFVYTSDNSPEFEEFDLKHYQDIKNNLVPLLSNPDTIPESVSGGSYDIVEEFIVLIWTSSFLYKLDDTENFILESSTSPLEVSDRLAHFNFEDSYGSTKAIEPVPRLKISKACLSDLIELSSVAPHKNTLAKKSLPYFVSRCCFVLRKYLSDSKLLNIEPIPRIQQVEIKIVLQGLLDIFESGSDGSDDSELYSKLNILYPLLVECISGDAKIKGGSDLVRVICVKFGNKMLY